MAANKMTGEKGVLFTATYVTKFEEMEKQIYQFTPLEVMQMAINQLVVQEKINEKTDNRLYQLEENTEVMKKDVNELRDDFKKYKVRLGDKYSYIVARELNLFSNNDKPHSHFIDSVAKKLKIYSGVVGDQNDYVNVIMENTHQGTAGVTVHYSEKAVNLMTEYLSEKLKIEIEYYQKKYKEHKVGDVKGYVYRPENKNFNFNEKTYQSYLTRIDKR